jgi:hypothetical protein
MSIAALQVSADGGYAVKRRTWVANQSRRATGFSNKGFRDREAVERDYVQRSRLCSRRRG